MSARNEMRLVDGPAGSIDLALDWPTGTPRGVVLLGHPHPLHGGTRDNKVVTTLARAFGAAGWLALRPNFRGVGASDGTHDNGRGEIEDFLHLHATAAAWLGPEFGPASLPWALAGFSFGSFVAAHAAQALAAASGPAPQHLILVGAAAGKWPMPTVPATTLVIHGEHDATIPLVEVFDWLRPLGIPVVVLPGADHFFHRRLGTLKGLVIQHLCSRPIGPRPE